MSIKKELAKFKEFRNNYDFKLSNINNDIMDNFEILDSFDLEYLDKKYPNSIIILGENDENIKI